LIFYYPISFSSVYPHFGQFSFLIESTTEVNGKEGNKK